MFLWALQRDHRCMNTQPINHSQPGSSLRLRSADFFIMKLSRSVPMAPSQDSKPLRRFLRLAAPDASPVGNENMCVALWELMARF
jgi:hypothetical protein